MGELRASMEMQENLSAEDWPVCIEFCIEAENNPPHNTSIEADPQHASLKRMRDPNDNDQEIEGRGHVRRMRQMLDVTDSPDCMTDDDGDNVVFQGLMQADPKQPPHLP